MYKYGLLKKGLKENGAEIDKTEVFEFDVDNFSMKASVDIKQGDYIAYIPLECIVTEEVALKAQSNQALQAVDYIDADIKEKHIYTLFIMEERRNPESKWKSYIDIYPVNYSNFLQFWSQEELKWL